ncbi:MAG: hypothetical protein GY703_00960 [Gammaproteobacteria bacterium]|nr:hypothetical protein [Gammaproteobacteria bacterium]
MKFRYIICLLLGVFCLDTGAALLSRGNPLVEDLLLLGVARDRLQDEFTQLDSSGKLSAMEQADFESYLGRLDIRIARKCQELALRYSPNELRQLPCQFASVPEPLPMDLSAEQTPEEQLAAMEASLASGLAEFDEMLLQEQKTIASKAPRSSAAGQGGDGGGPGGGGYGSQLEGAFEDESSEDSRYESEGNAGGDSQEQNRVASAGGPQQPNSGRPPADIPDGSDDDVVARQLREAAQKERDPKLQAKLWEEYRRYKSSTR